jgi:hypothetical protein
MHADFTIDDGTGCIEGRYWLVGDGSDNEFLTVGYFALYLKLVFILLVIHRVFLAQ